MAFRCSIILPLIFVTAFIPSVLARPATNPIERARFENYGPLCGVYGVYLAARLLNRPVNIRSLVRNEFVSSPQGSTIRDLQAACSSIELSSRPLIGLSTRELKNATFPLLLHVRAHPSSNEYDHFILLVSLRGEKALVIDGPKGERWLDLPELARHWSGTALAISREPIGPWLITWTAHVRYLLLAACVVVTLWLLRWRGIFESPNRTAFNCAAQAISATAIIALTAVAFHLFDDFGLLKRRGAMREIEEWHTDVFLRRVDSAELRRLIKSSDVEIIDARAAPQYENGHLPRARLIPSDSAILSRGNLLRDVPRDRVIVTYCDNPKCGNARLVAQILISDGFKDVRVFEGGWQEWRQLSKLR